MSRYTPVPLEITPDILALCMDLAPTATPAYLSVTPFPRAMARQCFPNVDAVIKDKGGTCQHGWKIWEWPHLMLEAVFHGMWVDPSGRFVDVTPEVPPVPEVLFLPDAVRRYQGKPIRNVRRPLRDSDLIVEYIDFCSKIDREKDKGRHDPETFRVSYPLDVRDRIHAMEEERVRLKGLVDEEWGRFLTGLQKSPD